jgi:hypothetical protein
MVPNKTRFPKDWDDRRIIQTIDETIDSPDRIVRPIPPNQRYQWEGCVPFGIPVAITKKGERIDGFYKRKR